MTRHISIFIKIVFAILLVMSQHFAFAQESKKMSEPVPSDLELVDEINEPTVTIRKPEEGGQIMERKESGGVVKEIKVQTGISTYYLYPNEPVGSMRGDATSTPVRPALWRVHEFDFGETKQEETEGQNTQQPAISEVAPPATIEK